MRIDPLPRLALVPLLAAALGLAACASISSIEEAPEVALSEEERAVVRTQVDKARGEGAYADAWNQEVRAGGDRERLETIALDALQMDSGDADDMFRELIARYGGLEARGRARADAMIETSIRAGKWEQAAWIAIVTATDAPAYAQAFEIYGRAPVGKADDVLGEIQDARREFEIREAAPR